MSYRLSLKQARKAIRKQDAEKEKLLRKVNYEGEETDALNMQATIQCRWLCREMDTYQSVDTEFWGRKINSISISPEILSPGTSIYGIVSCLREYIPNQFHTTYDWTWSTSITGCDWVSRFELVIADDRLGNLVPTLTERLLFSRISSALFFALTKKRWDSWND